LYRTRGTASSRSI